ncbi:MAG TPA: hypothetical protein VEA99_17515 [Gemmatimonadaceae bacterium]|nr:hypothetical protein [Gemmatimonadaceae bacterium]
MASGGERDRSGAHEGDGDEAVRGESTYRGEAGERERGTPGRQASRIVPDAAERAGHQITAGGDPDLDAGTGGGPRRNPPLREDVASGDGGLSASGGIAGGARGHGGTSDAGAGGPTGDARSGPGEHKSTSRGNLDHPTSGAGGRE